MHELALSQAIVENVSKIAIRDNIKKIKSITVDVGPLSGVERHSLSFCFPEAAKKSLLEGSELIINEIPLVIGCAKCGKQSEPEAFTMECKLCKSDDVEIISGREFKLASMEIE